MKLVVPGGSGHVGASLQRHFTDHDLVVLSRDPKAAHEVNWDGRSLGAWAYELEGADAVINLAGRSVNCRCTEANLKDMMDSRIDSTRVIGEAIAQCKRPPKAWLQASTATIYAHRLDAPNDESTGMIGGDEPGAPYKWNASIAIAKAWERTLTEADTPYTRKVALRSAMTMSPDRGSVFETLAGLTRRGLGGQLGSGDQYVSWIHEQDFARAVDFLIQRDDIDGPVNVCSPNPLPQKEFAKVLRDALGVRFSLTATPTMVELGCWLLGTESELVMKSRRVIPGRLLEAGFTFEFPSWVAAAKELSARLKTQASTAKA